MSHYLEIENRLTEIDGGLFQQICYEILSQTETSVAYSSRSGSQSGTLKTIKGTPDSYFIRPDGRYILVECSTITPRKEERLITKIQADIRKCLDPDKTSLSYSQIEKIIYCFNAKLSLKAVNTLLLWAAQEGITLELKSRETLTQHLVGECRFIARDHFGVAIDTGQILPPSRFVKEYTSSGLTTGFEQRFLHRERETKDLLEQIFTFKTRITIIRGAPGVGKSKLALAVMENPTISATFHPFCISNKNANIHDDLRAYLPDTRSYLILVDDANRQTGHLQSLLGILREPRQHKIYLLITVRDYAFDTVYNLCQQEHPSLIMVPGFSYTEMVSLLSELVVDLTPKEIDKITNISNCNARLALMSLQVLLADRENFEAADVESIYDRFYGDIIADSTLSTNQELQRVLGLLCFFYNINIKNSSFTDGIAEHFDVDKSALRSNLEALENLELAECSADFRTFTISDQIFATYYFYVSFIRTPVLNFRNILKYYAISHRDRLQEAILPTKSDFSNYNIYPRLLPMLRDAWNDIEADEENALNFLNLFATYRPAEAFDFIRLKIANGGPSHRSQSWEPRDLYVEILAQFLTSYSEHLLTALNVVIEFVGAYPDTYQQLIDTLNVNFMFHEQPPYRGHVAFWKALADKASKGDQLAARLFTDLAHFLMRSGLYLLPAHSVSMEGGEWAEDLKRFRLLTWARIDKIFPTEQAWCLQFMFWYFDRNKGGCKPTFTFDFPHIIALIDKYFNPDAFAHAHVVGTMLRHYKILQISDPALDRLTQQFGDNSYQTYQLLAWNLYRENIEKDSRIEDFKVYAKLKKERLAAHFKFDNLGAYQAFEIELGQILSWYNNKNDRIPDSVDLIFLQNYQNNGPLAIQALTCLMEKRQFLGNDTATNVKTDGPRQVGSRGVTSGY